MTTQNLLKEMLENAVHFGHKTTKWNPRMKAYIYGEREGIHIIDLSKTAAMLETAMDFLAQRSSEGASILFVGTKPQSFDIVKSVAEKCGQYYIIKKWVPGFLTNFSTIKVRVKRLRELKKEREENGFSHYTKKEASKIHKEIEKLEDAFGGVEELKDLPKVLVVADSARDVIAITESHKMGIPAVAIVDTNADPHLIAYPVPGNDDAVKSLQFFFSKFEEAILKGGKPKIVERKEKEEPETAVSVPVEKAEKAEEVAV